MPEGLPESDVDFLLAILIDNDVSDQELVGLVTDLSAAASSTACRFQGGDFLAVDTEWFEDYKPERLSRSATKPGTQERLMCPLSRRFDSIGRPRDGRGQSRRSRDLRSRGKLHATLRPVGERGLRFDYHSPLQGLRPALA